jgi:hypothetical protein
MIRTLTSIVPKERPSILENTYIDYPKLQTGGYLASP